MLTSMFSLIEGDHMLKEAKDAHTVLNISLLMPCAHGFLPCTNYSPVDIPRVSNNSIVFNSNSDAMFLLLESDHTDFGSVPQPLFPHLRGQL